MEVDLSIDGFFAQRMVSVLEIVNRILNNGDTLVQYLRFCGP